MSYFKPLRRKIGVFTLLIGCVFAAGWVRSLAVGDTAWSTRSQLLSFRGGLFIESYILPPFDLNFHTASDNNFRKMYDDSRAWDFRGFDFALSCRKDRTGTMVSIYAPYWSFVVPLTLLSTWLLLSKPRAKPRPPQI